MSAPSTEYPSEIDRRVLVLEIYADVTSRRAFLAQRQMSGAIGQIHLRWGHQPAVLWRPILIDPTAPSPSTRQDDASAGARWRASSWAAHRLIASALDHGPTRQGEVVEAIMTAHFAEGIDINDGAFLRAVAQRFDLPAPIIRPGSDAAPAYLEPGIPADDRLERVVREALLFGRALGVEASPTFVIDDRIVLADRDGPLPRLGEVLPEIVGDHFRKPHAYESGTAPAEVRRFRAGRALLDLNRPQDCLYLLEPMRSTHAGETGFETLTAEALAASASLRPAHDKLVELLVRHPDDAYLHLLMGKILKRMGEPGASTHLMLAAAMNSAYANP